MRTQEEWTVGTLVRVRNGAWRVHALHAEPSCTALELDGIEFDGRQPNAYLEKFAIGLKGAQKVEGGAVK